MDGFKRWSRTSCKMLSDELQANQPQAKGLINHFQHEHEDYHELISYCIDNDIPIKSIGIQAHAGGL